MSPSRAKQLLSADLSIIISCYAFWKIAEESLPATTKSSVIYYYTCACEATYVGKTTQRLTERIKQHIPDRISTNGVKRTDSAILAHLKSTHVRVAQQQPMYARDSADLNVHQDPLTSQTCHQGPVPAGVRVDQDLADKKNFIFVFRRERAGAIFSSSCWPLSADHRWSGGGHDLHSRLDL